MILNDAGKMIDNVWNEIPIFYYGFEIDTFQIMPDHIHGIISIVPEKPVKPEKPVVGAGPRACPNPSNNTIKQTTMMGSITGQLVGGQPQGVAPTATTTTTITAMSLSDIVHRFKTLTTKRYIDGVK